MMHLALKEKLCASFVGTKGFRATLCKQSLLSRQWNNCADGFVSKRKQNTITIKKRILAGSCMP